LTVVVGGFVKIKTCVTSDDAVGWNIAHQCFERSGLETLPTIVLNAVGWKHCLPFGTYADISSLQDVARNM
jgi:hypothetical protein